MRVGISIGTTFESRDHRLGPRSVLEQALAAARAGLDTLSLGDHHSTGPVVVRAGRSHAGPNPGRVGQPPGGLPVSPAALASRPHGRADRDAGRDGIRSVHRSGWARRGARAVPGHGLRLSDRARLFEEGVGAVQALLRGETVDSAPWGIAGARIAPLPPDGTEWWIGGTAPAAIDRAARLGDCWYGNADLTPETAASALARLPRRVRQARTPTGTPADPQGRLRRRDHGGGREDR